MAIKFRAGNRMRGHINDKNAFNRVVVGAIFEDEDTENIYEWNGTVWNFKEGSFASTDTKPSNAKTKSTIVESDTENKYRFDGTNWKFTGRGKLASSVTKPTQAETNSIITETDTDNRYIYDGTNWNFTGDGRMTSGQTKPSNAVSGATILETDTKKTFDYNGSAWVERSGGGAETHAFTTAQTFTPATQTGVVRITTDTTDVTSVTDYTPTSIQINVDGSSIGDITDKVFTRVVNPTSSLTIQSLNPADPILNYDSISGNISGGLGLDFKSDGTKAYGINSAWRGKVWEYNLSTPWDLSTLSVVRTFSPPSPNGNGYGMDIRLKHDGTSYYELSRWYNKINEYSMSTPYNISTASYAGQGSTSNTNQTGSGMFIKDDGIKVYVVEYSTGTVQQHSMSTAWDITTLAYDSKSFSVATQESNPQSIYFKSDGTKMYVAGGNYKIYRYSLSTAWDVSTASYDSVEFDVTSGSSVINGLYLKPDFTKWFVYGGNSVAYQHSIDTTFEGSALVTVG